MGKSASKYEVSSLETGCNDTKVPANNKTTVDNQMKDYGTNVKNGHSEVAFKDEQEDPKNAKNCKGDNSFMQSSDKDSTKQQEKYRRQAECGIGCCRPRWLQCWAKTLWSFVGLYGVCALWLITLNYYLRTQVTSVERFFRINSSQMGILQSCNDFGSLIFVLIGSHFGKFLHMPRLLALSAVLISLCVMSLSLTQAITPTYLVKAYNPEQTDGTNTSASRQRNESLEGDVAEVGVHWGYYLTCVVMFLVGSFMSYRLSLQTYYIERNVQQKSHSGIFLGVLITAMVFGSPISLFLGGAMNEMPVDLEDSEMDMYDPRWISAWWLGFLIIGSCALISSIPVFCLPRHIIHDEDQTGMMCCTGKKCTREEDTDKSKTKKEKFESVNDKEWIKTKSRGQTPAHTQLLDQIKDWPRSLKRVLLYPVICLVLVEWFLTMGSIAGTMAFELKYLQDQFDIPAASVSYYLGYAQLATAVVGTFVGGFLITRMSLTTSGMYKLCWAGQFVAICGSLVFLGLDCPDHNIQGLNTFHNNLSVSPSSCSSEGILFVCGSDGRNYLSPCLAGCKYTDGLKHKDCHLLDGGSGTVVPGFCEKDCHLFVAFIVVYLILVFAATMTLTPRVLMMARTVQPEDQPLVTGLGVLVQTGGAMVGPLLFGKIYDLACVLWPAEGGACLLSDKDELRLTFLGAGSAFRGAGLILLAIATIMMHVQQKRNALTDTVTKDIEVCKNGENSSWKSKEDSVTDAIDSDKHRPEKSSQDSGLVVDGDSENGDGYSGNSQEGPCYHNRAYAN